MTQDPRTIDYPAENWIDRKGQPILLIVAHDTEGIDSRSTLQHGDGRYVSVHKLIQRFPRANGSTDILPGKPERQTSGALIYEMVPDGRGANHAGYSTWTHNGVTYSKDARYNVNHISLGFELECLGSKDTNDHYSNDQLLLAGYTILRWRQKYGPLPIVRHAEIDPTRRSDTYGLTVGQLEQWVNAAALAFGAPPVSPPPAPSTKYRVRGTPVWQQQSCTGPVALYLNPGTIVEVDKVYPDSTAHLATGAGFIRLDASMEAIR